MATIHASAVIGKDVVLGEGCEVGPFCVIEDGVELGRSNRLVSHVRLEGQTFIGDENEFHPFSCVGAVPQDLKFRGEPTGVRIGSHNTFREGVTVHRGTHGGAPLGEGMTVLGSHNLIMAYTHVAHDCVVGNHVVIANGTQIAGHVILEDYCRLGGVNLVTQKVRVGQHAFTGAGVTIRKDIAPFVLGAGDPVFKPSGINRIGLERLQFEKAAIRDLKEVYKIYFSSQLMHREALDKIRTLRFEAKEQVDSFLQFIEESQVGVHR